MTRSICSFGIDRVVLIEPGPVSSSFLDNFGGFDDKRVQKTDEATETIQKSVFEGNRKFYEMVS